MSQNQTEDPAQLFQAAAEMFGRAESAREEDRLEDAARFFGRAAGTWRSNGNVIEAADAYLELGFILLRQNRGHLLPDLAFRVESLLEIDTLPEGAHLNIRVFAALMAKGAKDRDAFLGLVQERRLGRHRLALALAAEVQAAGEGVA